MIEQELSNTNKSATVDNIKNFRQLNKAAVMQVACTERAQAEGGKNKE